MFLFFIVMQLYYPHMPLGRVWMYRLLFVCVFFCNFVWLQISSAVQVDEIRGEVSGTFGVFLPY